MGEAAIVTGSEHAHADGSAGGADRFAWPDDYTALDQGRLRVRPDCAAALQQLGWTSVAAVMDAREIHVLREVDGRDNCTTEIPGAGPAGGPLGVFVKRHRMPVEAGRSAAPQKSPGLAEANAAAACRRASVSTVSVVAAGAVEIAGAGGESARVDSFVMTELMGDRLSAADYWKTKLAGQEPVAADVAEARRGLIGALALATRRLHRASLFHKDLFWNHFFVGQQVDGSFDACLIDLQRLRHISSGWQRCYWELKDLSQMRLAMYARAVGPEDVKLWYRRYFDVDDDAIELSPAQRIWAGLIYARALIRYAGWRWRCLRLGWSGRLPSAASAD
ncbi:MAG: lipopolysaccharide kinase InaA family protein [Phycisphaerae bacterium]|nr:lipopolysaccharide kinase InaA family protein [Phycisphaerae bacterium]